MALFRCRRFDPVPAFYLSRPCVADETIADEASDMLQLPSADTFINLNLTCDSSAVSPCGEGSWCLEGDLGVYCERYQLRSTSEEVRAQDVLRGVLLLRCKIVQWHHDVDGRVDGHVVRDRACLGSRILYVLALSCGTQNAPRLRSERSEVLTLRSSRCLFDQWKNQQGL